MIRYTVDSRAVFAQFSHLETRQIPFAMMLALTKVANIAQAAERDHMRHAFKLRRADFVLRGVKIEKADRATKTSLRVVIRLAYPDERAFMKNQEDGGDRTRHGGKYLWRPNQEVFKSKVIGRSNPLAPRNLHMARTAGGQIKGQQQTFLVKTANGQRLVLQRVGKDQAHAGFTQGSIKGLSLKNFGQGKRGSLKQKRAKASTRVLYHLVKSVRIPARLEFVKTITKAVNAAWEPELRAAVAKAMGSAR